MDENLKASIASLGSATTQSANMGSASTQSDTMSSAATQSAGSLQSDIKTSIENLSTKDVPKRQQTIDEISPIAEDCDDRINSATDITRTEKDLMQCNNNKSQALTNVAEEELDSQRTVSDVHLTELKPKDSLSDVDETTFTTIVEINDDSDSPPSSHRHQNGTRDTARATAMSTSTLTCVEDTIVR